MGRVWKICSFFFRILVHIKLQVELAIGAILPGPTMSLLHGVLEGTIEGVVDANRHVFTLLRSIHAGWDQLVVRILG